jgi:hypothetical protein
MGLTVDNTDWNEVVKVEYPGGTSNLVFKLTGRQGEVLWLKCAPGLERAEFASKVLNRVGYQSKERIVFRDRDQAEAALIVKKIAEVGGAQLQSKIQAINGERANQPFLIMAEAGTSYQQLLTSLPSGPKQFEAHLELLKKSSIQKDIARLIAADMLLGNFDRIAAQAGGLGKFHAGNFVVDATDLAAITRFLPIDNDTLAPSVDDLSQPHIGHTPTTEDLYRVVIEGGVLKQNSALYSAGEQASMVQTLGTDADKAIHGTLRRIFITQFDQNPEKDKAVMGYAQVIAPLVKEELRILLAELKQPGGGRTGLNKLMKAYNNAAAMNYDSFKVKCRFADLMVNAANLDPAEAQKRAMAYGKYRDWKAEFSKLLAPPKKYAIPKPESDFKLSFGGAVTRKAGNIVVGIAAKIKKEKSPVALSHHVKKLVREEDFKWGQLRNEYKLLKDKPDTDRAVRKAKILCIANLLKRDLQLRSELCNEVGTSAGWGECVALFYCKAMLKKRAELYQMCNQFRTEITVVCDRLNQIEDDSSLSDDLRAECLKLKKAIDFVLGTAEVANSKQASSSSASSSSLSSMSSTASTTSTTSTPFHG